MRKLIAIILLSCLLCGQAQAQTKDDGAVFPDDAAVATAAVVSSMRGWGLTGMPATLAPDAHFEVQEPAFHYDGFSMVGMELLALDVLESDPDGRFLEGILHFEDQSGRHALAHFGAVYTIQAGQGLTIQDAGACAVFAPQPRFEMLAVPVADFQAAGDQILGSYDGLLAFARKHAVAQGEGDYVILVFAKDRLQPGASLSMILSEAENERDPANSLAPFHYVDFDGWLVGMAQGHATLGSEVNKFHLGVLYAAKGQKPVRVAAFDSLCTQQAGPPAKALSEPLSVPSLSGQELKSGIFYQPGQ